MEVEPKPNLTLGEFLQKTREKKGWNVEYIAEQLKLKQSTVKALEANNYNEVGGMVYVKGYLRSYAKLLNLNIDKALDQLHAEHLDASPISTSAATSTAQTLKPLGSFYLKNILM
jgi:cytoskeleton protein RodZ